VSTIKTNRLVLFSEVLCCLLSGIIRVTEECTVFTQCTVFNDQAGGVCRVRTGL
jgi:hypothetical protein